MVFRMKQLSKLQIYLPIILGFPMMLFGNLLGGAFVGFIFGIVWFPIGYGIGTMATRFFAMPSNALLDVDRIKVSLW